MKGSSCRCGFKTISARKRCSRCRKLMKPEEWPDEGRVLSNARLGVVPNGLDKPYDLVLVGIDKGPKLLCWSSLPVKVEDLVKIDHEDERYFCSPKQPSSQVKG